MERRGKVELFEQIRREYEFGVGTIKGVARNLGVHRRMVRQALAEAWPPQRRRSQRERPVVGPLMPFIVELGELARFERAAFTLKLGGLHQMADRRRIPTAQRRV